MNKDSLINDWKPETRSLLKALTDAGCVLVSGNNGEDSFKFTGDMKDFIANLTACDESALYVTTPTSEGKERWISLVYGNSPGELVSDYTCDETIDAVTTAHYDKWSERKQPTMKYNEAYPDLAEAAS